MLSGTYEVRSLETGETAVVELVGSAAGRLKREAVVAFIAGHWAEHGWAPTMRETAQAAGLRSIGSVHMHLALLANAGRIRFQAGVPRSLRVVQR